MLKLEKDSSVGVVSFFPFVWTVNLLEYTAEEDGAASAAIDLDAFVSFVNLEELPGLGAVRLLLFDDWLVCFVTRCVSFSLIRGFDRASSNGDLYDANDILF